MTPRHLRSRGFTLLEVLVALFILAGAIMVLSTAWTGNFMRMRKTALFNDVSGLLERKMVELDTKYKNKGFDEIPEDEEGDFGADHPHIKWRMKTRDLKLPDLTPIIMSQQPDGADEMLLTMIKQVTEFLSKAIKEMKVSVLVRRGSKDIEFNAVQYYIDYTKDFAGALGGGAAPGAATPQTAPPGPQPGGGSQ